MTAIAGVIEDGKVWIGGDSAGVAGLSMQVRSDPKVFVNGEFIFGYTHSFRMGQLLEHEFSPPVPYEKENGMKYMVKRFIPAVKTTLNSNGFQTSHNGQDYGGTFLVGYRGQLYYIGNDYQVAKLYNDYYAVGCGMDLVLGSLHTTSYLTKIKAEDRIRKALDAAAEFNAGVRAPYTILSI